MITSRFILYARGIVFLSAAIILLLVALDAIGGKKGYLFYDKKAENGRKTGVATVKKLYENRDTLFVDISYHYKGEFGDKAYLHITPGGVPNQTVLWGYQIIKLLKGSHTVSVRIGRPIAHSAYVNTYVTSNYLVVSLRARKIDADNKERHESFVREVITYKKYWAWGDRK